MNHIAWMIVGGLIVGGDVCAAEPADEGPVKPDPLVQKYDTNRNGKLDPEERLDAMQAARTQFRKADTNGDRRVDSREQQAALTRGR